MMRVTWHLGDITDRGEVVLRPPSSDGWALVWVSDRADTTRLVRIEERQPSRLTAAWWEYVSAVERLGEEEDRVIERLRGSGPT